MTRDDARRLVLNHVGKMLDAAIRDIEAINPYPDDHEGETMIRAELKKVADQIESRLARSPRKAKP